ncbi:MAG: response regulator [Planctomycetaceae bacterium]|jgi:two-component system chemotaxis response regulator CheY
MNRLLIADDALIMRMKIRDVAQKAGWTVVGEASNGAEAVAKYAELRPDLVTMDLVMPELDGLEALRAIRGQFPEAAVVMISAVNQKERLRECISAGAVDFIVKPFQALELQVFFERSLRPAT